MTFLEAVKTCFGKYVSFSERARRPEFWNFVLFLIGASIVLSIIDGLIFGPMISQTTIMILLIWWMSRPGEPMKTPMAQRRNIPSTNTVT